MTGFFYVLGWAVTLAGLAWAFFVAAQPVDSSVMLAATAKAIAMVPGFGVAGSGLIFVAVGAVLSRLDRLVDGR